MKNTVLKVVFGLAAYSGIVHLPYDINAGGKALKDYNRQKTYDRAVAVVAATGTLKPLDESGCSKANDIYARVLSDSHYKLFRGAVQQTGERFYSACTPLIK
jgi:hypothetical protein